MYLPTQQQNDKHFANGSYNKEGKSNKPTALFIGPPNTDRIDENKLSTSQCNPDVVIINSLTNDVKNNNPNECMDNLQMVVESISKIIDGPVKRRYLDNNDVYVSDNSNMWIEQVSIQQLLDEDKFHLSDGGTSALASNIKNALHTVSCIKVQQRNNRYSRSTDRARPQ
ncbi:unnamed protein product [Mytilus coruscus]|uniref:Uncharacterized protein n=1 Tax=Mytilus coruscus TaxID=42192 RepID=A0A6J8CEW5_MYTCO|nr:unnamed protein product [Mytilus coruscus]